MGETRNFKFGTRIDLGKSHLQHDKISPKRAWLGSSDQKLNFKTPFRKSRMGEARNFKFGILIDLGKSHLTSNKVP